MAIFTNTNVEAGTVSAFNRQYGHAPAHNSATVMNDYVKSLANAFARNQLCDEQLRTMRDYLHVERTGYKRAAPAEATADKADADDKVFVFAKQRVQRKQRDDDAAAAVPRDKRRRLHAPKTLDALDRAWAAHFGVVRTFVARNRRLPRATRGDTRECGFCAAAWLNYQRTRFNGTRGSPLSLSHVRQLESLGLDIGLENLWTWSDDQ